MKFSGSLSALLVVLPLLLQAAALPNGRRTGFGFGGSRFGSEGNNNQNANKNNNNNNAASAKNNNNGHAAGQNTNTASAAAQNANTAAAQSTSASSAQSTSSASSSQGDNTLAASGGSNDANLQTSLTLDPSTIGPNLAQNGLNGTGSEAGQVASLTSVDNFINFCSGKTITNGLQVKTGSCNPVPMGDIPANTVQPAAKFIFPVNGQNINANTSFTVQMAISNLDTGFFVNPNTNYFGAPQQLVNGVIQGHSHIVIQPIPSFTSTAVVDPTSFSFFLGLNAPAANGVLTAAVTNGLPEGVYRMGSINTAANHQPALGPVAQHGTYDDTVYFSVGGAGGQSPFGGAAATAAPATAGAANGGANNAATNTGAAANNATASTGAKNTGAANNAGAANTGAKNTGASNNAGAANSGAKNTGAVNTGAKNTGAANNGAKNTGAKTQGGFQQGQQGKGRRSFNIARQE